MVFIAEVLCTRAADPLYWISQKTYFPRLFPLFYLVWCQLPDVHSWHAERLREWQLWYEGRNNQCLCMRQTMRLSQVISFSQVNASDCCGCFLMWKKSPPSLFACSSYAVCCLNCYCDGLVSCEQLTINTCEMLFFLLLFIGQTKVVDFSFNQCHNSPLPGQ